MARLARGAPETGETPARQANTAQAPATTPAAAASPAQPFSAPAFEPQPLLMVTGAKRVIAVLDELEDGLLGDLHAIDPYMCTGGCFGSPLLSEDHHVAAYRWAQGRAALALDAVSAGAAGSPLAKPRNRPFAARPGLRLDPDMGHAIEKLGRLQAIIDSLPGRDCGACGAPTCAALAEDVVTERADIDLCPYVKPGTKEDSDL
jgi:hypothetical protein